MISCEIKKLFYDHNDNVKLKNIDKYYNDDLSFNWIEIEQLLNLHSLCMESKLDFSSKNCANIVECLKPIYISTIDVLDNLSSDPIKIQKSLQWLDDNDILVNHLIIKNRTESYFLESIALSTSFLEFALGNIYFTLSNKGPPHLLKDLLKTNELNVFFGDIPIIFLQILIGSPNSINLRNIVWHGFPTIKDLPAYYHSTLILIAISLSTIITSKENFHIKLRKKISILPYNFETMNFYINNDFQLHSLMKYYDKQTLIPDEFKEIWFNIFYHFSNSNYIYVVLLILPQIELILRILYRNINNYNVEAKFNEYYIIMDTIFEINIANSSELNKIFEKVPNSMMKLLYDIFISVKGPRIRDKVSHGEINLNCIKKDFCKLLISLSLSLCSVKDFQLSNYESQFHPNTIVINYLKKCAEILQKLFILEIPKILKLEISLKYSLSLKDFFNVKIFHRPPKEIEINSLLCNILKNIYSACTNLLENFNSKFMQLENFTLRSRSKKTLNKMLDPFFKEFLMTIEKMLKYIEKLFSDLQDDKFEVTNKNYVTTTIKFLKKMLKYTENLMKYCLVSNSEWEKSLQICLNFNQNLDSIFS